MFRNLIRWGALLAPALLLFQTASASDIPRLSFDEMTDVSEIVVSGHVTRTWTAWDAEHKYIWTHYELAVSAVHKGAAGPTVDIAEPGGAADGIAMSISGGTGYRVGESVLVFLSRMPNGYLRTSGFGQGKFLVDANGQLQGSATLKIADTVTVGSSASAAIRSLDGMTVSHVNQLVSARVRIHGGNAQ